MKCFFINIKKVLSMDSVWKMDFDKMICYSDMALVMLCMGGAVLATLLPQRCLSVVNGTWFNYIEQGGWF